MMGNYRMNHLLGRHLTFGVNSLTYEQSQSLILQVQNSTDVGPLIKRNIKPQKTIFLWCLKVSFYSFKKTVHSRSCGSGLLIQF